MIKLDSFNIENFQNRLPIASITPAASKDGHLWKIINTRANRLGGSLHEYVLRPEYNNYAKFIQGSSTQLMDPSSFREIERRTTIKQEEIYPAIEETWHLLIEIEENLTPFEFESTKDYYSTFDNSLEKPEKGYTWEKHYRLNIQPIVESLHQLGFNLKTDENRELVTLTLPNEKALLSNWNDLRTKYPELANLKIRKSLGKETDINFIKAFINGEFILSRDEEFVHDMTTHIYRFAKVALLEQTHKRSVKYSITSLLDVQRNDAAILLKIIEEVTEKLPEDQKSKFVPLINIIAQNIDYLLGFQMDLRPQKCSLLSLNEEILYELEKATKKAYSIEDMLQLKEELYTLHKTVSPENGFSSLGIEKSGYMWKFESRVPNPNGGYLYTFLLDPKFNNFSDFRDTESKIEMDREKYLEVNENIQQLNKILYPAVESPWTSLLPYKIGLTNEELIAIDKRNSQFDSNNRLISLDYWKMHLEYPDYILDDIHSLGYGFDYNLDKTRVTLTLPDCDALLSNWAKLKLKAHRIADLKILPAAGIASDKDFINAFLDGYFVLSDDREFIHDHTVHLLRYITTHLTDKTYQMASNLENCFKILRAQVKSAVDKIEQVTTSLSKEEQATYDPLFNILSQNLDFLLSFQGDLGETLGKYSLPIIFKNTILHLNDYLGSDYTLEEILILFQKVGIQPTIYVNK